MAAGTASQSEPVEQSEDAVGGGETADGEQEQPTGAGADSTEPLGLDVVFEILKNERRRLVLEFLADRDDPVSIGDLAEHIAAIENDKTVQALSSKERKRVYVGLYQCHLPKMDDAGVVEFERNPGISLGVHADQVMEYLERPEPAGSTRYRYYAAFAAAGLGLLAVGLAVPATALVAHLGAAGALAGALGLALADGRPGDGQNEE